jgi:hypothetical protein
VTVFARRVVRFGLAAVAAVVGLSGCVPDSGGAATSSVAVHTTPVVAADGGGLVVPVTALLKNSDGEWIVELPDGTYVAVEVGQIDEEQAHVSSDELAEGDLVVVP